MALLPVEEALARIRASASRLGTERVSITRASGRVLAEDLAARLTQPPFDASAMDGYAVKSADASQAGARLRVAGASQAGRGFSGTLGDGEAVRIFTGAPIPRGADSVIIQENVALENESVVVREPLAQTGANVRTAGIDFTAGHVLLRAGRLLDAHAVTLAAAMGHGDVLVSRKPRVALLATGDELVPPGTAPGPDQIISSNPVGLRALLEAHGADVVDLGIAPDVKAAIAAKVAEASRSADILVTIGGASVGDFDLIGPVLQDAGMDLAFWKVAMRPGKPLLFGKLGALHVMGLPGNPVSALITGKVFLLPLLDALEGKPAEAPPRERAVLTSPIPENADRLHLLRARLSATESGLTVAPLRSQDSSLLSVLADANCAIVREPHAPAAAAGDIVMIERF